MTDHLTENARLRAALRACAEIAKWTPKHPACEKVIAEVDTALTTPAPDVPVEVERPASGVMEGRGGKVIDPFGRVVLTVNVNDLSIDMSWISSWGRLKMPVTERMKAAARYMQGHFEYKPDGLFETWRIGRMRGDCEDFALTTLWLLCGEDKGAVKRTLLADKPIARIIRTKTHQGNYHAVLQYNGKFICNRYPTWSDWRDEYVKFDPYKGWKLRLKLLLS